MQASDLNGCRMITLAPGTQPFRRCGGIAYENGWCAQHCDDRKAHRRYHVLMALLSPGWENQQYREHTAVMQMDLELLREGSLERFPPTTEPNTLPVGRTRPALPKKPPAPPVPPEESHGRLDGYRERAKRLRSGR